VAGPFFRAVRSRLACPPPYVPPNRQVFAAALWPLGGDGSIRWLAQWGQWALGGWSVYRWSQTIRIVCLLSACCRYCPRSSRWRPHLTPGFACLPKSPKAIDVRHIKLRHHHGKQLIFGACAAPKWGPRMPRQSQLGDDVEGSE